MDQACEKWSITQSQGGNEYPAYEYNKKEG
jgi:hypothetical protein